MSTKSNTTNPTAKSTAAPTTPLTDLHARGVTHHANGRQPRASIKSDIAAAKDAVRLVDVYTTAFADADYTHADRNALDTLKDQLDAATQKAPVQTGRVAAMTPAARAKLQGPHERLIARRQQVSRVATEPERDAAGIGMPLRRDNAQDVVDGIDRFLRFAADQSSGDASLLRRAHVTQVQLDQLRRDRTAVVALGDAARGRKQSAGADARKRDELHLALEEALAGYAAACYGAFDGKSATQARKAALAVIPRRGERRRAKPPAAPASAATTSTSSASTGTDGPHN